MGLEKVVEDILRRGEEKRKEIISLGEKERDEQIRQAEAKAAEERQNTERRTQVIIAQMDQQELSSAELESKRSLLEAQRQVMEALKDQVLAELEEYPEAKRKRLYSKLVQKAKKELGTCKVYSTKADKELLQLPYGVTHVGFFDGTGGLIFESADGSLRLDYRFESILEDLWSQKMREIYGKLFG